MKRIWGHLVSLLIAGLALGSLVPACATNDQSIYIQNALAPSANRMNGSCSYTSDPQQTFLPSGFLDIGLSESYQIVLLIGNQLIARGDPAAIRAESNRIHINGGVVRVTEPDGSLIREFTSLTSGLIDPSNNNVSSYVATSLIAFDAPTKDAILNTPPGLPNRTARKSVVLNIKVFGRTLGGEDIESGEFSFPLQVCNGCLVDFTSGNDPLQKPSPNCAKTQMTAMTGTPPCVFGQDEVVKCETCIGRLPACDPQNK